MDTKALYLGVAAIAVALIASPHCGAASARAAQVSIDADDIGGVVTGPNGPEAGVWVIAETTDLPTRYTKSVVTDDQGRYVIPDLPVANYRSGCAATGWSTRRRCAPSPARSSTTPRCRRRTRRAAAHYYPAIYWYTMMKIPPAATSAGTPTFRRTSRGRSGSSG